MPTKLPEDQQTRLSSVVSTLLHTSCFSLNFI